MCLLVCTTFLTVLREYHDVLYKNMYLCCLFSDTFKYIYIKC